VQKVLVDELKHGSLSGFRECIVEVLLGQACNLWGWIEERTEPQREDFLEMGTKLAFTFADEGGEGLVSRLSDFFVSFVHKDATKVV